MKRSENEALWRDALGGEAAERLWQALEPDAAVPVLDLSSDTARGARPRARWPLVGAVAAALGLAALLGQLSLEVRALRVELADLRIERLQGVAGPDASPVTSLASLDEAWSLPWSGKLADLLGKVVAGHEDPNVQLRAIDLLAGRGAYPTERLLALADAARHNRALLRAYVEGIRRI